jgi:GAF domain-containing protein
VKRIAGMTVDLRAEMDRTSLFKTALRHSMSLLEADFGNVQVLDPACGGLRIAVHSGFDADFLRYFEVVIDDSAPCGRALATGAQAVIADVETDEGFAPHLDIARATGFRAVQSTPILDVVGRPLGIISTHWRRLHRPEHRELLLMERIADVTAQALVPN